MTATIAQQVVALQTLDIAELVARYTEIFGKPPRNRHRVSLWRAIGWELQARHYGRLSPQAQARLEQLVSEIRLPSEPPAKTARVRVQRPLATPALAPGTTLTRTWHGRELRVTVLEHGFEFDGAVFRSLSAVARHVTGTGWSGNLFFGLRQRIAGP